MNSEASPPSVNSAATSGRGLVGFFDTVLTTLVFFLLAAGLIAVTATWRSSTVEFVGSDRMRLTESEWWGLHKNERLYRAGGAGWAIIRENGDEVSVAAQPILIKD